MNIHIISLLNYTAEQTINNFSRLHSVKNIIDSGDIDILSEYIKQLADFYIDFLQKINFLPLDKPFYKRSLFGTYDSFNEIKHTDPLAKEVVVCFSEKELFEMTSITPIHIRYSDPQNLYLANGISWIENKRKILFHLTELSFPKHIVKVPPHRLSYVTEILELYDPTKKDLLRDLVTSRGIYYNQFQKDCKEYWGDTFYKFFMKKQMIEALDDILFTKQSFNDIAIRHKFVNYTNLYRTFIKHGLILNEIIRLAN